MTIAKKSRRPAYLEQFQCIGSACADTCCTLWKITIDKQTYRKYQSLENANLRKRIKEHSVKDKKTGEAYFEMNQTTGDCPMLCDGLCSIQATMGESYLSRTCSTYPRIIFETGEVFEASAQTSCPEVVRLLLFSEHATDLSTYEGDSLSVSNLKSAKIKNHSSKKHETTLQIRELCFEIVKNREFTLEHRMIMLGVLFDNIRVPFEKGSDQEVLDFLAEFKTEITINAELRNYDAFPQDSLYAFQVLNNSLMELLPEFRWNRRYNECMDDYLKGMQKNGSTLEKSFSVYRQARDREFLEYVQSKPYVFENYVWNYFYQNFAADIMNGEKMFDFFTKLVIDYSLIRLHLVGMAAQREGLEDEQVLKLVQSYTKNYKFSNTFLTRFKKMLHAQGFDSLGGISILLK